ncbi:hypothetical protein FSP39_002009 [Pinctada imbricata]|uniref:Uncharacterized protein n=1 Tax=Pinctada imbricata TaxID=66713 RepID=A0AA89BYD0_PINIB|nr:hypothetical protein FSP39_002009 [Pinctada imbricata]
MVYHSKHSRLLLNEATNRVSIPILKAILESNVLSKYFKGLTVEAIKEHDLEQISKLSIDQLIQHIKSGYLREPGTENRLPHPHECTPIHDVVRIEYVYKRSQISEEGISEEEFDELWTVLNNVAKRMDRLFAKTSETFVKKLDTVKFIKPFHKKRTKMYISEPCLETVPETECIHREKGKHVLPRFSTFSGFNGTKADQTHRTNENGACCRIIVVEIMDNADTKEVGFFISILESYAQTCEIYFIVNENRKAQTELCNMKLTFPMLRMNIMSCAEFDMTDALYRCLHSKLMVSMKLLSDSQDSVAMLQNLASECKAHYRDTSIPEELSKRLKRLSIFGVLACTAKGEKVFAYVLDRDQAKFEAAVEKLKIIKKKYPFLEWKSTPNEITMKEYLQPGDYITIKKVERNVRGTLGIYGKRKNNTLVALTGAHVIEEKEDVYFKNSEDKLSKLGSCIFSPRSHDAYIVNIKDIGVIEISEHIMDQLKTDRLGLNTNVFEGKNESMFRKRVFKYGGTTDKTEGFVVKTNYQLEIGDQVVPLMLVEKENQNDFAKQGDSGSVVICKRGPSNCDAVAVVFGGQLTLPDVPPHWGVVVRLDKALKEYSDKMNDTLFIDRF